MELVVEGGERDGRAVWGLMRNGPWFARDAISSGPIAQMASSTALEGSPISLPMESQMDLRKLLNACQHDYHDVAPSIEGNAHEAR